MNEHLLRKRRRQAPFNTFEGQTPCAQLSPSLWEVEQRRDPLTGMTYVCSELNASICPSLEGALVGVEWAPSGAPNVDCLYDKRKIVGEQVINEYTAVWGADSDLHHIVPSRHRTPEGAPGESRRGFSKGGDDSARRHDKLYQALAAHPALRGIDAKYWCRPQGAMDAEVQKRLMKAANEIANVTDDPSAIVRRVYQMTGCAFTFRPVPAYRKRLIARTLSLMQPQHMSGTESTLDNDSRSTGSHDSGVTGSRDSGTTGSRDSGATGSHDGAAGSRDSGATGSRDGENENPVLSRRQRYEYPTGYQLSGKSTKFRQTDDCAATKKTTWTIVLVILLIVIIIALLGYFLYYSSGASMGVAPGVAPGSAPRNTTRTFYQ